MALQFDLVIPAYNESKNLPMLIERVVQSAQSSGFSSENFHLILVNNGSTDNSAEVLKKVLAGPFSPWVQVVQIDVNRGYGHGIWTGLTTSTAPYVGWTHADLQCDPLNAFKALALLQKQNDKMTVVKGIRYGRSGKEIFVSRIFEILARWILGLRIHEINAQPKVFPRQLLRFIQEPPINFAFDLYVLFCAAKNGFKIITIDVTFPPRIHGVSKWAATFFGRYKTILGMIVYMWQLRVRHKVK